MNKKELSDKIEKLLDYAEDRANKTRAFRESIENEEINSDLLDKIEDFINQSKKQQDEAQAALDEIQQGIDKEETNSQRGHQRQERRDRNNRMIK